MDSRKLILVVDDEKINRQVLIKILSAEYDCIEANNGLEAWNIIEEKGNEITAVLLDIIMPEMNGYEFLQKIRQASLVELPIIAVTGETDKESERKVLDAGAWDFVPKPYQPKVLQVRLRNAIARRQASVYERIQKLAAHDPLTGLHNRERTFAKARKLLEDNPDTPFIFIRADLDRFALYNSAFGETEGDKLICFLAEEFSGISKQYEPNSYGRINADIFCAILPYSGKPKILKSVVDGMQAQLAKYKTNYSLELSVGVYVIEDHSLSMEECYLRATIASQKCKNKYGEHIGFYDEGSLQKAAQQVAIESEMKGALEEHQFQVYLQPKITIATEKACGAEALVRWIHPSKGMISPGDFIPVFESNGFIADLDYYVWEETCRILKKWIDEGETPLPISVNISRVSLYNPKLKNLLLDLINKYQIDVSLLQLEITESAYMTNPDLMQNTVSALRDSGFIILMDDFGSGYSSLNTLKDMEVDILKLDMKFLPKHDNVGKGEIILASMIRMAKWLGMEVVVEGVETIEQRDFLEGAGCAYIQGFYYSKPIPNENFSEKYLEESKVEVRHEVSEEEGKKNYNTILLIDDAETDRDIINYYLSDRFYIHQCTNAEDALVYLKRNHRYVKLILVDIVMPGMSGLDFLIYCQDEPVLSSIPKIMITASDESKDQIEAFRHGAYDYITKPLNMEIVEARINHVMERRSFNKEMHDWKNSYQNLAERDRATGLFNKTVFSEISDHFLGEFRDDLKALLVIDLDDFKGINDIYGHLAGDKVIKMFAECLLKTFRKTDIVGRFGGDEFTVFMTSIPNKDIAKKKADEVVKNISVEVSKELRIETTVSIGIAFSEADSELDEVFEKADQALYEAKRTGKCKVVVYGEEVPAIEDDDKPVILICGEDPQSFPTVALAYGNSVSFAQVSSLEELREYFNKYQKRISVICIDMQRKVEHDSDLFYKTLLENGGGDKIPILAICKEGNMEHLRQATALNVHDVLTLPPDMDTIKRRLSRALAVSQVK